MTQSNRHGAELSDHPSTRRMRTFIELSFAFAAGTLVLVLPVALDSSRRRYPAAAFPIIRDAVEGIKPLSFLLLLIVGFSLGIVCRTPSRLLAVAAVAVFPLWSIVDLALGGQSHNLLPFEWLFYAFYGVLVLAGAGVARWIRGTRNRAGNAA